MYNENNKIISENHASEKIIRDDKKNKKMRNDDI